MLYHTLVGQQQPTTTYNFLNPEMWKRKNEMLDMSHIDEADKFHCQYNLHGRNDRSHLPRNV